MGITRRKFSKEFKVEAVRLVQDRGVSVSQAEGIWMLAKPSCAVGSVS
jgi:transposase-like protein